MINNFALCKHYFKLQNDLLKEIEKGNAYKIRWTEKDGYIYFTDNGFQLFKIPSGVWFLDLKKTNNAPLETLPEILKNVEKEYLQPARLTGNMRISEDGKTTYCEIASENITLYVNEKLLKRHGENINGFKVYSARGSVALYEGDRLTGIILPANLSKNKADD